VVDVAAGVQHKRVPLVTREILSLFDDLARSGPTDEELAKARRRVLWDARSMRDSAEEMGSFYAGGILFDRQTTPEEHVAALVAVTPADVREVARWMVRPERLSVTAVGLPDGDQDTALEDVVDGWRAP
jgi:predicted Zn-dependent peptidase